MGKPKPPEPSTDPQDNQDQPNDENIRFFNLGVEQGKAMAQDKQRETTLAPIQWLVDNLCITITDSAPEELEDLHAKLTALAEAIIERKSELDLYIQSRERKARIKETKYHWGKLNDYHDWAEPYFEDRLAQLNQPKEDNNE